MIILPAVEDRTIISLVVCTKHRNVTDGQTDRQTDRQISSGYYSVRIAQCGRCKYDTMRHAST